MILGALGKILGSETVIKKGMDLIDDMHTSETESIEAKTQAKVALMNSYAPFKVAQRYLALMFGLTYVSCFIIVLAMTLTGKGDPSAVSQVMEHTNSLRLLWLASLLLSIQFPRYAYHQSSPCLS